MLVSIGTPVLAQQDAHDAMTQRGRAIKRMIHASGDASIEQFIQDNVSPELVKSLTHEELMELLRRVRKAGATAGGIEADVVGPGHVRYTYHSGQGSQVVEFRVDSTAPFKISELTMDEVAAIDTGPQLGLTWTDLAEQLQEVEKEGFSGSVLVVRGGEVVVDQGYGMADRKRGIPNTTETLYAIGSTPIDFTKAAILKLEDMGKLQTADPIGKYLSDVPKDKQAITLDHLMTGESGLPNFHGNPDEDDNLDLSWIDRDTAIKRILGRELLFPPGEGNAHSHSAWGLLAAIVEIVSEESYGNFLQSHFFEPAGMQRTGLYPLSGRVSEDEVAVGYGLESYGKINSPAYWGDTSWLVMGSGGMVSNPRDLYRWVEAIRGGELLSEQAQEKFWTHGALAGANDRGFLCIYTVGPGTMVFLCSNSHEAPSDPGERLGLALVGLVQGDNAR